MSAEFTTDKPIYLQILDYCMNCISSGEWVPEGRIPAVKELSLTMTVNPRTVMRAYEELEGLGVIFQRRGLGFYVAPGGPEAVTAIRLKEFETSVLPDFIERLRSTGYPVARVIERLSELEY